MLVAQLEMVSRKFVIRYKLVSYTSSQKILEGTDFLSFEAFAIIPTDVATKKMARLLAKK